jgi:tetratricopeptide (TPR) repeat protein
VPLSVPLAFVAGPALLALLARLRRTAGPAFEAGPLGIALCALLFAQAFWPRLPAVDQPSSVHYFNLASVEEAIGRDEAAADHYGRAAKRNPREPMFRLREAHVLRRLGRARQAASVLDELEALPKVPETIRAAAVAERKALGASQPQ